MSPGRKPGENSLSICCPSRLLLSGNQMKSTSVTNPSRDTVRKIDRIRAVGKTRSFGSVGRVEMTGKICLTRKVLPRFLLFGRSDRPDGFCTVGHCPAIMPQHKHPNNQQLRRKLFHRLKLDQFFSGSFRGQTVHLSDQRISQKVRPTGGT